MEKLIAILILSLTGCGALQDSVPKQQKIVTPAPSTTPFAECESVEDCRLECNRAHNYTACRNDAILRGINPTVCDPIVDARNGCYRKLIFI